MKYIWEEEDLEHAYGKWVCKPEQDGKRFKPDGWTAKWTSQIGFIGGSSNGTTLICIADGMVGPKRTPKEMVDQLNADGMIPMPHKWLIEMIEYLRD